MSFANKQGPYAGLRLLIRLLLIVGIWAIAFYGNYSNPKDWDFVRMVFENPFVVASIALLVLRSVVSDYLEYRVISGAAAATTSTMVSVRTRYKETYGKDVFFRLDSALLLAGFLSSLVGVITLSMNLMSRAL